MIRVRDLEKRYGAVRAVKGISFEVGKGEIVGLLGHNGAGKSTVLKIITGYLEPSDGSVSVGGVDVLSDRVGVQSQIGYLPENAPLYPEMLVQEYLLMMAELRGIEATSREQAVAATVAATGLEDWLVRPIATLSKGYRQRVGLAQAIVHQPELLVLDEPTSGLDPVQIVEIRGLIHRLAEHSTVILSTHILSEIEAVCDRVVILIDGLIAADSRLSDLLTSNRVRLSVAAGTDSVDEVEKTLARIDGIDAVARVGVDPERDGYDVWTITCASQAPQAPPTPAIVRAATEAGWSVASVGAETHNLEQVFRDLMSAQLTSSGAAENAAADR